MTRIYPVFLLLVLLAPFAVRAFMPMETSQVFEKGAVRLVVVTPHNQDIRREFARAFDQWHRTRFGVPVSIDYRMPGGANDIKRVLETTYRAYLTSDGTFAPNFVADIDIIWGGGDYFFDHELKTLFEQGGRPISILQRLEVDPQILREAFPHTTLAGVKLLDDQDRQWVGVCLASFGIVYNADLYQTLRLPPPRQWEDLTDPRLSGLVALADPSHSASAAVAYMVIIQRAMADAETELLNRRPDLKSLDKADLNRNGDYQAALAAGWKIGMSRLLLMAANARYFTASGPQVPNDVGGGDAAAGIAIDFYGRVYEEIVGQQRCRFIAPIGATSITPDPVGILHGVTGEKKILANHFVEFLLSPQAQRLWILKPGEIGGPSERALRRQPIRQDVYSDRRGWTDDINPYAEAHGFNQRAEWMALFTDTRPIWVAAWIDSRDALKDAYARILRVGDIEQRNRLLAELGNLPVELSDVANQRRQRQQIESARGDIDLWKASQRIAWASRFREHFRRVAESISR